jgi:type IV pilus assembly protein PilB
VKFSLFKKKKDNSVKEDVKEKEVSGAGEKEGGQKKDGSQAAVAAALKPKEGEQKLSVIKLVDTLIQQSYRLRASDIHLDPEENLLRVRLRIDGVMHDSFVLPKSIHSEVITRIKVMAGMRTDEHQMAQDGRIKASIDDKSFDVRVSIAPTYYGENCVMRLLAGGEEEFTLESLGFSDHNKEKIERAIRKPYGMILATGPTGSGKTTTLYTILRQLNTKEVSIITIEDPIEYSIQGLEQIQVNERTGLVFSAGLRFILRQDPDIIMVGEIRDDETANIAVNAALTGHLLLSTLHTNDSTTTVPRLLDMGVEPFLITSTLNVALGQRLVRQLCDQCKKEKKLTAAEIENLAKKVSEKILNAHKGAKFYEAVGCQKCSGGYKSRIGIHEVFEINSSIRELIVEEASGDKIREAAIRGGMVTMLEDGFQKAVAGITTLEEVLRVFYE